MSQMLTYILTLTFTLFITTNCFQENLQITIPQDVIDFDYSPDQQFLAVQARKSVNIYRAQDLKELKNPIIAQGSQQFLSFAFSADSTYLSIGMNLGNASLYKYNGEFFERIKIFQSNTSESFINGVCFLSSSKIVFAINQFRVAIWDFVTDFQKEVEQQSSYVTGVSCSPINESSFISISQLSANEKLNFYNFDKETQEVTIINTIDFGAESKIFGTAYSKDGTKLYAVGKQQIIFQYDVETYNKISLTQKTDVNGELRKIRVSDNDRIFAVASSTKIFIFTFNSVEANAPQSFVTSVDSVALSGKGGHVFYASEKSKGVDLGACPKRDFYDQIGNCGVCNDQCDLCWYTADECFICKQKYYEKSHECLKCSTGCLTCSDSTNCSSCDVVNHFQPDNIKCKCISSFFLNGEECSPCIKHCQVCTNGAQCQTCAVPYIVKGGVCACKEGTYDDGSTCKSCMVHCQSCSNGTQCLKCTDPFIVDDKGVCICKRGTYPDGQTCSFCMENCLICQVAAVCKECKGSFIVDDKGGCSCKQGTFFNGETCVSCNKHCLSCQDEIQCQKCLQPFIIDDDNHQCSCKESTFDDGQTCKSCIERCLTCINAASCQVCVDPFIADDKGICSCKESRFDDGSTCQPCLLHCQTCSNATECAKCYEPFIIIDNKACGCKERTYDDGQTCASCIDHCQNCKNGQKCQTCDKPFILNDDGLCICKSGTFEDGDTCVPCLNGCLQCQDGLTCTLCNKQRHFALLDNTCSCDSINKFVPKDNECVCIDGTFLNENDTCVLCNDECTTCTSEDSCTGCKGNQTLMDGKCLCSYLTQFYDPLQHSCVICGSVIQFCEICDSGIECSICNVTTRYVRKGQCVCRTGSYEDIKQVCQSCDIIDGCLDCQSSIVCRQCNHGSGWQLNATTNKCQCRQSYYRNQHQCILCEVNNCLSCLQQNKCTKCSVNRKLDLNECICIDGYYQNSTDLSRCQLCSLGCDECKDGDSCSLCNKEGYWIRNSTGCQCISSFYLLEKKCHNCTLKYQNCIACNASHCNDCKGSLQVTNNICGCTNSHQYQSNTLCLDCSQNCLTCSGGANHCLSCPDGKQLGQDNVCNQHGISTLLIIVFVVVGVIVLGIIGNYFFIQVFLFSRL